MKVCLKKEIIVKMKQFKVSFYKHGRFSTQGQILFFKKMESFLIWFLKKIYLIFIAKDKVLLCLI